MAVVESNQYAFWAATQSAQGTQATSGAASIRRFRVVAGDIGLNRDDGSENFSTLTKFGDSADFINSVLGSGDLGIQAQPDILGYLCFLYFGVDTRTTVSNYAEHKFVGNNTATTWSTWWKRMGLGVVSRQKSVDSRVGQLQIEGSTQNKIVRVTPTIMALKPGRAFSAAQEPVKALDSEAPFVYTEGKGNYEFAGEGSTVATVSGQTQFNLTLNDNLTPQFGDDVVPFEIFPGTAEGSLAMTLLVDGAGLNEYNKLIYGSSVANPPANDFDVYSGVPKTGKYVAQLDRGTSGSSDYRGLKITVPGIKWSPEAPLTPNPDGGPVELSLAGGIRLLASPNDYMVEIIVSNGTTPAYA